MSTSTRARPLSPDDRRAALIAAALPLLRQHGAGVTTRQLADASGVAEGTIFRAFSDKEALICAAVRAATDPGPVLDELAAVDPGLALRPRLVEVTEVLQRWLADVIGLMIAVRPSVDTAGEAARRRERDSRISAAVTELLRPDRDAFRRPLVEVVRLHRALVAAGAHPFLAPDAPLTADDIVDVLLEGTRRRSVPC